jgi:hypothetical protein
MWGKIKIDPLDSLFSRVIRLRANNKCQRCGKYKEFKQLQAAHCWGRRKKSVRYDLDNALGLCAYCHRVIDSEDPEAKKELFIKYLGEEGYRKLNQRANWPNLQKPDTKLINIQLKQKLKEYENA